MYNAGAIDPSSWSSVAKRKEWTEKVNEHLKVMAKYGTAIIFMVEVSPVHADWFTLPHGYSMVSRGSNHCVYKDEFEVKAFGAKDVWPDLSPSASFYAQKQFRKWLRVASAQQ